MNKSYGAQHTKALISLGLYLQMRNKNYNDISVKDICETAGVSRMSFYRYFNKKDDIFIDYCDERFAEFYESYLKEKNPSLKDFTIKMFYYVYKYSRQLIALKKAGKTQLLMDQFDSYTRYLISKIKFKELHNIKDNQTLIAFLSGGFFNTIIFWVNTGCKETPEEMADNLLFIWKNKKH